MYDQGMKTQACATPQSMPATAEDRRAFAEELGLFGEKMGLPPMAGRIWGWLLVCDPPRQTALELAHAVGSILGGISTMTRLLEQTGIIERVAIPGQRSRGFQIRPGGITELLRRQMTLTGHMRTLAEQGLAMLRDEPEAVRLRLEEYRAFYAFFEREMPALVDRWEQSRKGATS
jgi:hypothetical protein